uniref:Alkaline phosphatase n=1 Tax=Dugesia japonica TaxID=6161 RepID=A0A6B9CM79_DUGJA|nr:alkaline phosphatase [Dugesia japonica]
MKFNICFLYLIQLLTGEKVKKISEIELTKKYWIDSGREELLNELNEIQNKKMAKNVIIFIGDGMGPSTLASARAYKNQRMVNSTLPDINLSFESFSNIGVVKTHSIDGYVADSSSTATAIFTGVKIRSNVVGVGPNVYFENCSTYNPITDDLLTIGTMFANLNKSVGIVTTTRITHATPGSLYANTPSRNWEYKVPKNCDVDDIALQLFKQAEKFQVILGGGSSYFLPVSANGSREDNRNLLLEWKSKFNTKGSLVTNANEFRQIDVNKIDYLFGLLNKDHLKYDIQRDNEPSLAELTNTAIKILSKNKNGYFLLVEGGKIDHAHHDSKAILAILETLALESAVDKAMQLTNIEDTLILVTADHSHAFTLGSYAERDVDITQKNNILSGSELDKKGHTSLLYSNGPGFKEPRLNITSETIITTDYIYPSGVPLTYETHGGEDITVYANGPWAHLLNGLHQQSYIGHMMMHASCVGAYKNSNHCNISNVSNTFSINVALINFIILFVMKHCV